jgi:hypothetical protein
MVYSTKKGMAYPGIFIRTKKKLIDTSDELDVEICMVSQIV